MGAPTVGTDNGDNGNGRVTLAVVITKIDNLTEDIADIKAIIKECKIGLDSASTERHRMDKELTALQTKFEDIDAVKKAIIGNVVAVIFAIGGVIWALVK